MEPEQPRGDEPEFGWIDDLDFEVLDCEEIELADDFYTDGDKDW
jgi:hypothetical protein